MFKLHPPPPPPHPLQIDSLFPQCDGSVKGKKKPRRKRHESWKFGANSCCSTVGPAEPAQSPPTLPTLPALPSPNPNFFCMGEHVKFVRLPLSCAELWVTFNLCRCTAVMKYLLWECDDQMTLSTFVRTLSGVDLVRHGDQSAASQPLSVGLSVCRPRVLIKPILHSTGERTACPLYRGQQGNPR